MDEMRKTIAQTKEGLDFMEKIEIMSPQAREHLRLLLLELVKCYLNEDSRAVVLIDHADADRHLLMAVNANEFETAALVGRANEALTEYSMDDAPPKEMFN